MTHRAKVVLEAEALTLLTLGGRVLIEDLGLVLEREHVAIVGRNGVGKSTLLSVLAGKDDPARGRVRHHGELAFVPQELDGHPAASRGERRRRHLAAAFARDLDLLLLDEPTEDLDIEGVDWLCGALDRHAGAVLVVSHHRHLLRQFHHFFVLEESGCRYLRGSFEELERDLLERHERGQRHFASQLNHLEARERHDVAVRRRRRRKKNLGRLHEEARGVSRMQLQDKKRYAQVSQAKAARIRDARLAADRAWVAAARRALAVRLPLELCMPVLPGDDGRALLRLDGVTVVRGDRVLVEDLSLTLGRERLAVLGPNGAGKSSLLDVVCGVRAASAGDVSVDGGVGAIAQGATDWQRGESLVEIILRDDARLTAERAAEIVVAHSFPLGLALRPLASLSAGERTRAALIALIHQAPRLLILDEPTYSLDFVGASALADALARWPGGLVVASHDRGFLDDAGISAELHLDGRGGYRLTPASGLR